ncbi:MAG: hypothetical protein QXW41_07490 [Fervidicoccaceae archaeon]
MAKRTVTPDAVAGSTCTLISTRDGRFYVAAKAAPIYGDPTLKGKVFALVVDRNGNPIKVAGEDEARNLGCAVVKIPRRNVPKSKFGTRELERLGLADLAKHAKTTKAPSTKVKKYRIGFLPARLVGKLFTTKKSTAKK